MLKQIAANFTGSKIVFTWEIQASPPIDARSVTTDTE